MSDSPVSRPFEGVQEQGPWEHAGPSAAAVMVAVLNLKGGSGKSTLATNLARSLQRLGHAVLLIDTDAQGTLRHWQARQGRRSDQPPVVGLEPERFAEELGALALGYDVVIVDGTAKVVQGVGYLVHLADLVLIPVQPSAADLWAVSGLAEMVRTRRRMYGGCPQAAFVISRQIPGARPAAPATLEAFELPVLQSRLTQRIVYAEALARGMTVLDVAPGGKAAREVEALRDEILARFPEVHRRLGASRRTRNRKMRLYRLEHREARPGGGSVPERPPDMPHES
ncbi:AAA family ATPase [Rhodocaloribacter litoris]|uniref:ParA family partition ATPase n=1 Tax=Rhodocaloribacter litoris TaxID=2558931 RepID=UPI00142454D4|nr:ParA family partition ATPase [Rhodocaloribacter litoris]QXD16742.1 AAA family ATPase [Rhodocaloribacter litoris]